jgi:hypothetical protein
MREKKDRYAAAQTGLRGHSLTRGVVKNFGTELEY